MKVIVRGKNVEVTNAMENYVQEKVKVFIDKYFDDVDGVEIHGRLRVDKQKHDAEITIHFHHYDLRGEAKTDDMYVSIDEAMKKIEAQYIKHKERLSRKNHKIGGLKGAVDAPAKSEDGGELEIIRRKRFTLKPMNEEEAIMQMELIGHNFYVYKDSDSDTVNVVYRRKEGLFGVIETER